MRTGQANQDFNHSFVQSMLHGNVDATDMRRWMVIGVDPRILSKHPQAWRRVMGEMDEEAVAILVHHLPRIAPSKLPRWIRQGMSIAASTGRAGVIKAFVERGFPMRIDQDGDAPWSLLACAAGSDNTPLCAWLLDRGASVADRGSGRQTPLMVACQHDNAEIIGLLIERKAELDARNDLGLTSLILACMAGRTNAAWLLIQAGTDIHQVDGQGRTALHAASFQAAPGIVEILLEAKIDPHAQDLNGNTALHMAAGGGDLATCERLIGAGAAIAVRNRHGQTPLDKAGDPRIVEHLRQALAVEEHHDLDKTTCARPTLAGHRRL